ncbi:MAG: Trimethylamine methyltransferase MttB [Desulfobacterales bacterium]|nr:Trimethylamine methyltransferase MttB [Desulfobacterales bacterium]
MVNSKTEAGFSSRLGLNSFSNDELDSIHSATLDILKETGVKVESEEALEIFHGAGAEIDKIEEGGIVRIPAHVVEECIRDAPERVVLYGSEPEYDFVLEPGRLTFTLLGENVRVNDLYNGENRNCGKKDLGEATRVADALDQIGVVEKCMGSHDKPAATQSLHNYEAMVSNTGKHIFHGFFSAPNSAKIVEMAAARVGGMETFKKRPCVSTVVCPTSPLTLVRQCCDVIIACAGLGVGMVSVTMPLSGATSPATSAGTLATLNAEVLSSLVLAQLTRKHTPFIYGSCATIMDLRVARAVFGAPESGVLAACAAKMARYYKLPSWCGTGASSGNLADVQAGYEFGMNIMLAALAGCNIIFSCGGLESGNTFDYAKLIMDAEIAGNIQMALGGVRVTRETMALDIIKEVGPGGEYMSHDHTFNHMRNMSRADLFDRMDRDAWLERTAGKNLVERAYEKARWILENHRPPPLPKGVAEAMRSIVEEYEREL